MAEDRWKKERCLGRKQILDDLCCYMFLSFLFIFPSSTTIKIKIILRERKKWSTQKEEEEFLLKTCWLHGIPLHSSLRGATTDKDTHTNTRTKVLRTYVIYIYKQKVSRNFTVAAATIDLQSHDLYNSA